MIRTICLASSFLLLLIGGFAATASAVLVPPAEVSMKTVGPDSVDWPDSKRFGHEVRVQAGPGGADFGFRVTGPSWRSRHTIGRTVSFGEPTLEGPGSLSRTSRQIMLPPIGYRGCFRGGGPFIETSYRLTLLPGEETVVSVPATLRARPLAGMGTRSIITIGDSELVSNTEHAASSHIRFAPKTVRIVPKITWQGDRFRITGRTRPATGNRTIGLRLIDPSPSRNQTRVPLARARTRADGTFQSRLLRFEPRYEGWPIQATMVPRGNSARDYSCGQPLRLPKEKPATIADLDGHRFVSTTVSGPGDTPEKITLTFRRGKVYEGGSTEVIDENGPIMLANAGCNTMAARYEVRGGRLRWNQSVSETKVGCSNDYDRWLGSRLRKGLIATIAAGMLSLRDKRWVEIRLNRNN